VITAIVYSLLVTLNTGLEFIGFTLLLVSSFSIGLWAYLGGHRGILLISVFLRDCRVDRNASLVLVVVCEATGCNAPRWCDHRANASVCFV